MNSESNTEVLTSPPPLEEEESRHEQYQRKLFRRKVDAILKETDESKRYSLLSRIEDQFILLMKSKERKISHDDMLRLFLKKKAFEIKVTRALALCSRYGVEATMLMMDGDKFKEINDTYGHLTGDKVIQALGEAVTTSIRDNDIVCHWGGDEIAVLLMGANAQEAKIVINRIREKVPEVTRQRVPEVTWKQTVSIGIAQFQPGDNKDTLIERADQNLYEAKKIRNSAAASS